MTAPGTSAAGARPPAPARWAVLLAPVGIYFFSYFHRIAPAVVVEDLMQSFGVSASLVALLTAVYPWLFAGMAVPGGVLADALGPRWTLAGGAACMALGSAAFGLAPAFGWAVATRVMIGLGSSVILIAWLRLGSAWCRPDETARLTGLTQTVGAVGALVGTVPLAALVAAAGWRRTFVLIGGATALVGVASALIVRDRPAACARAPRRAGLAGLRELGRGVLAVVRNPRSWPPALTAGAVYGTFITLVGLWGVPYLVQVYGLSRVAASRVTAWSAVGVIVGAVAVGWLSDRLLGRRRLPMLLLAVVYALGWIALALPAQPPPLAWLPPLFFLLGVTSSLVTIVFAVVQETNDPARPGAAIGFCNTPIFTAVGLLQLATGAVLDAAWDGRLAGGLHVYPPGAYRAAFLVCALVAVGGIVTAWCVTETACRNVWAASRAGSARPR